MTLPAIALSIRQPWAWAIVNGHKNIENRAWTGPSRKLDREFRGFFAVHASVGMTRHEYAFAMQYMAKLGVTCPMPADLQRGGIVGTATIHDVLWPRGRFQVEWACQNIPWFIGPIGLKLAEGMPTDFIAAKGQLGWFKWKPSAANEPEAPKRWMTPKIQPVQTALPLGDS
jgi:hypothetical protein